MQINTLSDDYSVSPQIEVSDVPSITLLNLYMIYRGVSYMYIGIGLLIVALLKIVLECVAISNGNELFETYHPLCHYIAGIYVIYCVYFIKKSFK